MCLPLIAGAPMLLNAALTTSLATGIGSAVMSYTGQQAQAKATASAAKAEQRQATLAYSRSQSQVQAQQSAELARNSIEAAKARAQGRASAAEAGVSGVSIDALLADFNRVESWNNDTIKQNSRAQIQQLDSQRIGRSLSAQASIMPMPNPLVTGLEIANSLSSVYLRSKALTPPKES